MREIGQNLMKVYEIAEGVHLGLSEDTVENLAAVADDRLERRSARARVFVKAFVRVLRSKDHGKPIDGDQFAAIVDDVYNEVAEARETALEELLRL